MKIIYFLGTKGNPLYEGDFLYNNKYKTFGQHSFIYDFIMDCYRREIDIEIVVDDIICFSLSDIFSVNGVPVNNYSPEKILVADIILLDSLNDKILSNTDFKGYIIGIIHNHLKREAALFYEICKKILCLTPYALEMQKPYTDKDKLISIRQGIDLNRFLLSSKKIFTPRILIYSRMDNHKGSIYMPIIEELLEKKYSINVLGDGNNYQLMSGLYGKSVNFYEHIPCYYIHEFIKDFDIIISNGRGVMEGLASGKPTIAAGVRYCGLVVNENVDFLFERNFTGSNLIESNINIEDDIKTGFSYSPNYFRLIAERLFDVKTFTTKLINIIEL